MKQPYFSGSLPCIYYEHSSNNPVTQLIYLTFSAIDRLPERVLISDISDIKQYINQITIKPKKLYDFFAFDANQIIRNPLFYPYIEIVDLSRKILRFLGADPLIDKDDSIFSGFLFDISMLFEHYIRKLIRTIKGVKITPKLTEKSSDKMNVPVWGQKRYRSLLPDVIFEYEGKKCLIDVKYKRFFPSLGVSREDTNQIITYIARYSSKYKDNLKHFSFVFPCENEQEILFNSKTYQKTSIGSEEFYFKVFFIFVPKLEDVNQENENISIWKNQMNESQNNLKNQIIEFLCQTP